MLYLKKAKALVLELQVGKLNMIQKMQFESSMFTKKQP